MLPLLPQKNCDCKKYLKLHKLNLKMSHTSQLEISVSFLWMADRSMTSRKKSVNTQFGSQKGLKREKQNLKTKNQKYQEVDVKQEIEKCYVHISKLHLIE